MNRAEQLAELENSNIGEGLKEGIRIRLERKSDADKLRERRRAAVAGMHKEPVKPTKKKRKKKNV